MSDDQVRNVRANGDRHAFRWHLLELLSWLGLKYIAQETLTFGFPHQRQRPPWYLQSASKCTMCCLTERAIPSFTTHADTTAVPQKYGLEAPALSMVTLCVFQACGALVWVVYCWFSMCWYWRWKLPSKFTLSPDVHEPIQSLSFYCCPTSIEFPRVLSWSQYFLGGDGARCPRLLFWWWNAARPCSRAMNLLI